MLFHTQQCMVGCKLYIIWKWPHTQHTVLFSVRQDSTAPVCELLWWLMTAVSRAANCCKMTLKLTQLTVFIRSDATRPLSHTVTNRFLTDHDTNRQQWQHTDRLSSFLLHSQVRVRGNYYGYRLCHSETFPFRRFLPTCKIRNVTWKIHRYPD